MMTETITPVKPLLAINPTDWAEIEKSYTLRNSAQVLEFIDKYPFLVPLLREAPEKINQYFPGAHLFLQVVIDPEGTYPEGTSHDELFMIIATEMDSEESIERLWCLDEDWWLNASLGAQNKLEINLE
jgi:hypothetical protein